MIDFNEALCPACGGTVCEPGIDAAVFVSGDDMYCSVTCLRVGIENGAVNATTA